MATVQEVIDFLNRQPGEANLVVHTEDGKRYPVVGVAAYPFDPARAQQVGILTGRPWRD